MRNTINPAAGICKKSECQCKSCPFNATEGMCLGCYECIEHKLLAPVTSCNIVKKGNWSGLCAIKLSETYIISIPMGICDIPEYFYISKEEYDTFDLWMNDELKILEIENRL